ncbi:MAG: asparagine--tRNA ligase [bacterium]|nr:asparagine--tRNA ligase [bacterium]
MIPQSEQRSTSVPPAVTVACVLRDNLEGATVLVQGWVRTRRDSKAGFSFIELNDGSTFENLQLVVPATLQNYTSDVLNLHTGASISATGVVTPSPGREQARELHVSTLRVLGFVEPTEYPLHKQKMSFEHLRTVAHLRPRTNTFGAIARVRNAVAMAIHDFFQSRGFLWIATPIITASDCEGAGEMFQVTTLNLTNLPRTPDGGIDYREDFFGRPAFLTVSGQLAVENYACALTKVYTFGPTFRAENSNTTRHLAEFWMIEPEVAFADLHANMDLAEEFVKHVVSSALTRCPADMRFFDQRIQPGLVTMLEQLATTPFERVPYSDAIAILARANVKWEFPAQWGADLQAEHQRYLTEEYFKKPIIVYDWPASIKPFYMYVNDDELTVRAMDMLVPRFGEIIGGSQREHRLTMLDKRIAALGLNPANYWWYRDLRRFGTVPHSGFGLGFERLLQFITGMTNIRDVIPFPRAPKLVEF